MRAVRAAGTALAGGGALALAVSAALDWFSLDWAKACGWTCYSPSGLTDAPPPPWVGDPSSAFDGLGTVVAIALVVVVLAAALAAALGLRGRRVPPALAAVAAAGAVAVLVRVVDQPRFGLRFAGPAGRIVSLDAAAYVGSAAAVLAAVGVAVLVAAGRLESAVA